MFARISSGSLIVVNLTAAAETEGFASPSCGDKICFWRRPVVDAPPGWLRDEGSSRLYQVNAFAPQGSTFSNADVVIYAKAIYKGKAATTLADFIEGDRAEYQGEVPKARIVKAPAVVNGDGRALAAYSFAPATGQAGNWERIAYDEEGEYILLFALSARTEDAYRKHLDSFIAFVAHYRRNRR